MAIFNLLFRFVSSHILYTEWVDRGGMVTMEVRTKTVMHNTSQGETVGSTSGLSQYPGIK